jgi:hypothetical protein
MADNYLTETPLSTRDKVWNATYERLKGAGVSNPRVMTDNIVGNSMTGGLGLLDLTPAFVGEELGTLTGESLANSNYLGTGLGLGGALLATTPLKVPQGLLSRFSTSTPGRIVNKTKSGGGYSVNLQTGDVPQEGLMMGMYKNTDPRNVVIEGKPITKADVEQSVNINEKALDNPENYLGTWADDGTTYFDVSKRFDPKDRRKATKFGERTNQIAGYDLGTNQEFPVGQWSEFIRSPEYAERIGILNERGVNYLKNNPNKNWWNLKGTELEEIYGKENIDQIAGYLAATSPLSDVKKNVNLASEYLRRLKAGEEIIQPNFRIPEGSTSIQPGKKMPLETGYAKNLEKATRGDLDAMQSKKVRGMAKALRDDPDAMVFDRHWANLSEKPSAGIFTDTEKGIFPPNKQYDELEEVMREQAKLYNTTPANLTANVWTGYRDMAQKQGKVFGEKTAGAGILGSSKAIADVFSDRITEKAKQIGIARKDLIEKLKKGDISLLAVMGVPTTGLLDGGFEM